MTPAEHVRRHLATARAEGLPFSEAWTAALAALPPVEGGPTTGEVRERREWLRALGWSRAAFQASYFGEPESRREATRATSRSFRPCAGSGRIAAPEEAAALLAALPEEDRTLSATAMYAGLRRGELLALDWNDVDLEKGVLRVERSWDVQAGVVDPKSEAGTRTVPVVRQLGALLRVHRLSSGRPDSGFVFLGKRPGRPFNTRSVDRRAQAAWKAAELTRITMHECMAHLPSARLRKCQPSREGSASAIGRLHALGDRPRRLRCNAIHRSTCTEAPAVLRDRT